jgi:hypothetical protein
MEAAVRKNANLSGANLSGANLRCADLVSADLRDVDLEGANLVGADLRYADLRYANLRGADLYDANLSDAYLHGADLRGAALPDGYRIARLDFGGWPVTVTPTHTHIGCQSHPNASWLAWSPEDVAHMDPEAKEWWTRHGETVKAAIRDVQS